MSSVKPEVVEFEKNINKSLSDSVNSDKGQKAFAAAFIAMYAALIDIRDLLTK